MVCVKPDTAVPAVMTPAEAVEHEYVETSAVPLEEGLTIVFLLKLQFGVVFKVNVLLPIDIGVPEAVRTMFFDPVGAEKVPLAIKVTPLAVVEI